MFIQPVASREVRYLVNKVYFGYEHLICGSEKGGILRYLVNKALKRRSNRTLIDCRIHSNWFSRLRTLVPSPLHILRHRSHNMKHNYNCLLNMIVTYSLVCWYPCWSYPKWTVDPVQCSHTPLWTSPLRLPVYNVHFHRRIITNNIDFKLYNVHGTIQLNTDICQEPTLRSSIWSVRSFTWIGGWESMPGVWWWSILHIMMINFSW